ncbi:MAG TPA: helix-turn-helix domain-containing protein [Thermoanaerobaculia bacterium]|nr:helix-turn-helix domain-containing protein [Thermoanaerobaculia bacterium]
MPPQRSPEALSLVYLRLRSGWSQQRLAAALGLADVKQISRYESGAAPLSRERLDSLVAALGHDPEDADFLLFAGEALAPPFPEVDGSPVALTREELRALDRAVLSAGWGVVHALRAELRRWNRKRKADAARWEAGKFWEWLKAESREGRRELVECFPELWSWALAVRLCEESVRAAAHRAEAALELADLALFVARRVPGGEAWRSQLQGFAWAFVANARRVANDFDGADEAFARAWNLWQAGAGSASDLLPEWWLFDLEASLRREQQRFPEALERLDRARSLCADDRGVAGRLLLQKEHVLSQMGDFEGALSALDEAAPYIEHSGEPRLLFGLLFNRADNLYHLGRYAEAADLLPEVRCLVVQQANELDLVRVLWLEARIHAGQGRAQQATAALEQVQRDFTSHKLPYDAALSSLDLALLWLEAGRSAEVRELALGMAWIFASKKIHREALAALTLFYEAARQETATVELTRHVIATIEKVRRSAPRLAGRGRE